MGFSEPCHLDKSQPGVNPPKCFFNATSGFRRIVSGEQAADAGKC